MDVTRKKKLMVCFLPSTSDLLEKSILNSMAATLSPPTGDGREPMVHAELFFPTYQEEDLVGGHSCGIHYGGKVFLAPKAFSRKNWSFRSVPCTDAQYDKVMDFCKRQVGGPFNYMGYYAPCDLFKSTQTLQEIPEQNAWFCSELTASALQYAGILESDTLAHKHPEHLYQAIADLSYVDTGRNLRTTHLQL